VSAGRRCRWPLPPSGGLRPGAGGRRAIWGALVIAVVSGVATGAAAATATRGGRGVLSVPFADSLDPFTAHVALWTSAFVDGDRHGFQGGPLAFGFGVLPGLELTISMELLQRDDPYWRKGMADPITLAVKYRFLDETVLLPSLAVKLDTIRVDETVDLHPQLIVQKSKGPFIGAISLGYLIAFGNREQHRRAMTLGVAGQIMFETLTLGIAIDGRLDELLAYEEGSLRYGPLLSWHVPGLTGLELAVALQGGMGSHAADVRFFFGLTYNTRPEWLRDADDDSVPDHLDKCPYEPEDINQWEDRDGCIDGGPPDAGAQGERPRTFTYPRPRFRLKIPTLELDKTPPVDGATP